MIDLSVITIINSDHERLHIRAIIIIELPAYKEMYDELCSKTALSSELSSMNVTVRGLPNPKHRRTLSEIIIVAPL